MRQNDYLGNPMIPNRLLKRLSIADLKAVIKHKVKFGRAEALESERASLLKQVAKLDKKLAKLGRNGSVSTGGKRRRRLSAETRRKMAAAAKARWVKVHGKAKAPTKPAAPVKSRRTLSAATRAKMAAAAKARWAKVKGTKEAKSDKK